MPQIEVSIEGIFPLYYPGQSIKGICKIKINQRLQAKAMSLAFMGRESVQFTTEKPVTSENNQNHNDPNQQRETITHSQLENICSNRITIWGDDQRGLLSKTSTLDIGVYEHTFEFTLPYTTMPSSFNSKIGKIEYWVEVCVHKQLNFDFIEKKFVNIVDLYQLTKQLMTPLTMEQIKTICCLWCTGGTIEIECGIDRKAYLSTDSIQLELGISNYSARDVTGLFITLKRDDTYTANTETHKHTEVIAEQQHQFLISSNSGENDDHIFQIPIRPTMTPVLETKLIKTAFTLTAKISVSWAVDVTFNFPIIIASTMNAIEPGYFLTQSWPLGVQLNLGKVRDALPRYEDINGAAAVSLGALGEHLLRNRISLERLNSFKTATNYQMIHSGMALLAYQMNAPLAAKLLLSGSILFSGSIYLLVLDIGPKKLLGPTTPVGGILMISGWVALAMI